MLSRWLGGEWNSFFGNGRHMEKFVGYFGFECLWVMFLLVVESREPPGCHHARHQYGSRTLAVV